MKNGIDQYTIDHSTCKAEDHAASIDCIDSGVYTIYAAGDNDFSDYCILLIIHGEQVSRFLWITSQPQKFFGKFCTWMLWKLVIAGNYEHFFGNEGKDIKQWKYFTANNKQCTA